MCSHSSSEAGIGKRKKNNKRERERENSHWWIADNSVSDDSGSHEINDKFALWANVHDVLILPHFASDIYACRGRFHYHRACLIFLSCVRGTATLQMIECAGFSVVLLPFLQLWPCTSGHIHTHRHDRVNRERGHQREGGKKRKRGGGEEGANLRTWCQPERPTVPQSHLSSWGLWFAWLSPILRHTINTTLGGHLQF